MNALIVDDSRTTRLMLRQLLEGFGFEVAEAGNGREGLQQLRQAGPIGLALVDCNMPDMDGLAFVRAIRAEAAYRDVRLLMVTGEEDLDRVRAALEAGANAYVHKPFTSNALRAKLQDLGITPN